MSRRLAVPVALVALVAAWTLAPAGAGAGPAKSKTKSVKVRDDYYSPTAVKIRKNDKVKWRWGNVNTDSHDVTLKKGPKGVKKSRFRSIAGAIGITFKRKFTVPGRYKFYCTIHPDVMTMDVVVKKP